MAKDKKALQRHTARNAQQISPSEIIHNPVTLEFLGIRPYEDNTESKLETAILNNLPSPSSYAVSHLPSPSWIIQA